MDVFSQKYTKQGLYTQRPGDVTSVYPSPPLIPTPFHLFIVGFFDTDGLWFSFL